MTSLLQAAAADVREAESYVPKEAMPMTNEEAITYAQQITDTYLAGGPNREALQRAVDALRAQPEPGPPRDYEALDIAILHDQIIDAKAAFARLEEEKCEFVTLYRDATERADRLWKIVAMLQDMLDATGAGL